MGGVGKGDAGAKEGGFKGVERDKGDYARRMPCIRPRYDMIRKTLRTPSSATITVLVGTAALTFRALQAQLREVILKMVHERRNQGTYRGRVPLHSLGTASVSF